MKLTLKYGNLALNAAPLCNKFIESIHWFAIFSFLVAVVTSTL